MASAKSKQGWAFALTIAIAGWASPSSAQQVTLDSPLHSTGHSYYENIGVRWGLQGNGWFLNFGGPAPQPGFGGFDPNAQANFGTTFGNGRTGGFFQLTAGQGSDTTFASQSPSVTVPNGGFGFFSDTTQRPFVTGLIPVVGSEPVSPVRERLERIQNGEVPAAPPANSRETDRARAAIGGRIATAGGSSAERGDASVADIKAAQAAEASSQRSEIDAILNKARAAESAGQKVSARLLYQMAARRTTGEKQRVLLDRVKSLEAR